MDPMGFRFTILKVTLTSFFLNAQIPNVW
jgi:hypothetical protein